MVDGELAADGVALVNVEEAWEADADAGLGDDTKDMPMGMYTVVSEWARSYPAGSARGSSLLEHCSPGPGSCF